MQVISGFHAIEELLRSGAGSASGGKPRLVYCKPGPRVKKILEEARRRGIPASETGEAELDEYASVLSGASCEHRGILLLIEGGDSRPPQRVDFDAFVSAQKNSAEKALVLVLDSITDPHNVGAILRSCDQFGVTLAVLPERRGVSEGEIIARSSAGASAWVPQAVVSNLPRSVDALKDAGFWVYAADAGGEPLSQCSFAAKTVLVLGSEGSGISRLLREKCDAVVAIPTCGKIDSLNVSVACGILLYEIRRHR